MPGETPDMLRLVSIVIVNFDGRDLLRKCLASVDAQPYRPVEIIVVDNGSTDGSIAMLEKAFPHVKVLSNSRNLGFAEANNQGVRAASGEVVVLLNNDTTVSRGWIEGLLRYLDVPGVAVVTSRVITDGVPERFYAMNGTINVLGYNIMQYFADTTRVFFGGGASLAFRKRLVGDPFPEEYFLYHEDVYLSWRMRLLGYDVRMSQDSIVHHVGSASTKRQPSTFITFYQERNRLLNSLLLFGPKTLVLVLPYLVMDALAKISASLLGKGKSFGGILRAYAWVITHPRWIARQRNALQKMRVVSDGAILQLMSFKVLDGEGVFSRMANRISEWYAFATGLSRHE